MDLYYYRYASMTKLLLDSGDPQEYEEISLLLKEKGIELWGSTTNPSLIAKKIADSGKKLTQEEAFTLQKEIILAIIKIVPGAVSGEVYADQTTTAEHMVEQGRVIASWHPQVVVKLPTTIEGFKARTLLRKEGIGINNTLVFSQEQVFAICLHEKLMQSLYVTAKSGFPAFISPFLGRLDDKGEDGIVFLENAQKIQKLFQEKTTWMLAASIRNTYHLKKCFDLQSNLITAPAKVYKEWFSMSKDEQALVKNPLPNLTAIEAWTPSEDLQQISSVDIFMETLTSKKLDISHPLTTAGIDKFVADWQTILK